MVRVLEKASDIVYSIGKWMTFVYISGVTVLSILGVIFRTAGNALSWNEELMRWCLISLAYIGASVGMRNRNHIGIEFFVTKMKKSYKKVAIILGYVAIIVFLVIAVVYGFQTALNARRQYGSILQIQMIYVKMNVPLGALFMLVHMMYFTVGLFREKDDFQKFLISGGGTYE